LNISIEYIWNDIAITHFDAYLMNRKPVVRLFKSAYGYGAVPISAKDDLVAIISL
jgi:hypothetical protein